MSQCTLLYASQAVIAFYKRNEKLSQVWSGWGEFSPSIVKRCFLQCANVVFCYMRSPAAHLFQQHRSFPESPCNRPSFVPSIRPSFRPSSIPSFLPSFRPSFLPSFLPPFLPSFLPVLPVLPCPSLSVLPPFPPSFFLTSSLSRRLLPRRIPSLLRCLRPSFLPSHGTVCCEKAVVLFHCQLANSALKHHRKRHTHRRQSRGEKAARNSRASRVTTENMLQHT